MLLMPIEAEGKSDLSISRDVQTVHYWVESVTTAAVVKTSMVRHQILTLSARSGNF